MALYQFLCVSTVMIILLSNGCHSQQPVCGQAVKNTRIVGGQNASPGAWPWMVSLNIDGNPTCAGSLINDMWVLTAAHCLSGDPDAITVFLGRNNQSGPNLNEVSRGLDMIVSHPFYDFLTNDNDIALLKLSAPVKFTDYIQPVCLASENSTFHTGVSSWVTGFGATQSDSSTQVDILQEVNVPIVGNNECRCAHPLLTDNMICAGLRAGGKDACQGDSGAPMVTKKDFIWIQSGVVSFGRGCAEPMSPGGYTRVSQYQEWISKVIGNSKPGFVTYISSGADSDFNFECPQITTTTTTTTTTTPTTITTTTATTKPPTTTTKPPSSPDPVVTSVKVKDCDSVFDSGENVIHFSHFSSLCLLLISLYVLGGDI